MKYRLKDRELQKKLDDISDGDFSKQLEGIVGRPAFNSLIVRFGSKTLGSEVVNKFRADFSLDEIEEAPEYNPHGWNDFPKVTPPYDVLMRCEEDTEDGTEHLCMKFVRDEDGGHWTDEHGMGVWNCTRFRPWE